jgi:hypothetical protein
MKNPVPSFFEFPPRSRRGTVDFLKRYAGQCAADAAFWKLEPQRRHAAQILSEVERLTRKSPKRFRRRSRAIEQRLNRLQREVIGF